MADPLSFETGPGDLGKRLDAFLQERLPDFSRTRVQEWIRAKRVRVNGSGAKPSFTLRPAQLVEVEPMAPAPLHAAPEDLPLATLYEDEHLIAIDKPAGMVVHAGAGLTTGTVVNALLFRFSKLSTIGGDLRPGIVHRLDRYTSGVLLVAKTDAMHVKLAHLFASRQVRKTYLTLVHRSMKAEEGRIERPISRDPVHRARMTARLATGRSAWSKWKVLERFPGFTYLEVLIGTGRTHQIRVHLSSIGHPVVGDRLYGAAASDEVVGHLSRYFLHAHCIGFVHPMSGANLTIQSPLPEDLEAVLHRLRNQAADLGHTGNKS